MSDSSTASTRDRLVRAAADEFNRAGFGGTNTNKIARAAGFAPATFYRYFDDKKAIMVAAFDWVLSLQRDAILSLVADMDPSDVDGIARRMVECLADHQRAWQKLVASGLVIASEDPDLASLLHAKRAQDLGAMQAICAQLGGEPKSREEDLLLLLAVEGLCVLLATTDPGAIGVSEEALIEQMAQRIVVHVRS
ncbi:MAG: TetR/AcrR family transcriptional regulator [Polyangiaceae bacterium]